MSRPVHVVISKPSVWLLRMFSFLAVISLLGVLAWTGPVTADDSLEVIDSSDAPWTAIGRVNVAGFRSTSMCTGTLIAPNLVLTAAHCLYNRRTLTPFPVDDVLFVAGVRRDRFAARLEPECFLLPEQFVPSNAPVLADAANDFALLVLKTSTEVPPLPALHKDQADTLTKQTEFQSVGYRRSRRYLPTLVRACSVLGRSGGAWISDCPTEQGASGGPLLVDTPDGLRVAGITSGKVEGLRSAVVPFTAWQALLSAPNCEGAKGNTPPSRLRKTLD